MISLWENFDIFVGVYLFVCGIEKSSMVGGRGGSMAEEEIINLGTLCLAVEQTFTLQESTISYSIYKYFFFFISTTTLSNKNNILFQRVSAKEYISSGPLLLFMLPKLLNASEK